jgi:predicted TIM-barrel fold metal-dependent hydrolase
VLGRFPNLNFICVESGLGWVPFVLESCDYHYKLTRMDKDRPEQGDLLPSDLFRRQVYVNYWFEQLHPWHIDAIGIDHIMFETDFPHGTCLEPDGARHAIDVGLANLSAEQVDKILWRNAATVHNVDIGALTDEDVRA